MVFIATTHENETGLLPFNLINFVMTQCLLVVAGVVRTNK